MPQSLRHAVKGGYSLSQKRISPFGTPRERLRLAVSGLRKSLASGMEMPARGVAAFRVAIRLASAPTIRCCAAVGGSAALRMRHTPCGCRSAHLVEVQPNFRLPRHPSMRRAQQSRISHNAASAAKPHFAQCGERSKAAFRRQSAAEQTSLAPHDSKARLRPVTNRRDSWRSHVHRTYTAQRVQSFKIKTANVRGQGAEPLAFSLGFKGAILSRERMAPFIRTPCAAAGNPLAPPTVRQYEPPPCTSDTPTQGSRNTAPSRRRSCRRPRSRRPRRLPFRPR